MKKLKQISAAISVLTVICMLSTSIALIFAQGTTGAYILETDEKSVELSKEPIQNEMGLMVSACEVLNAINIQYEHDKDLDSFEIFLEENNIMLMHNATHYYKGEESIDCQPYFTVNDVPLIELGFLCNLINYTYEFNDIERKIVLYKIQDKVEEIEKMEIVVPVKEKEHKEVVVDLDEDNALSYNTSSYSLSKATAKGTLSGKISLPAAAPKGGINITLILENTKVVSEYLYGTREYFYEAGNSWEVANVSFSEGEKSKTYSIDVRDYQDSSSYTDYVIFYETETNDIIDSKGFVQNDGTTRVTSRLTTDEVLRDSIDVKLYKFAENFTSNILISEKDKHCGENALWDYDKENQTLTISGSGKISYNDGWYSFREEIKKIVIGSGITAIGAFMFEECTSLEEIEIPETVNEIDRYAFFDCNLLKEVAIPGSVNVIGEYSFYSCDALEKIIISDGVTEIDDYAFERCNNIKLIVVPKSVTRIGYNYSLQLGNANIAYKGSEDEWENVKCATGLIDIYFNYLDYVTHNGIDYLIRNNSTALVIGTADDSVVSITIPEEINGTKVTELGAGAFANKTNLISVTLPNNLKVIGERAFYKCSGLIGVNARDNITFIGEKAFYECNSLTNIVLPKELVIIEEQAFYDCINLTKVTIPEKVIQIGDSAFYYCSGLREVTIPDSVTKIGTSAFCDCNLQTVYIGKGLNEIGSSAFRWTDIRSVYISDLDAWCKITFGNESSNPLHGGANLYINNELVNGIVIPNDITAIKDYAFYGCISLQNVVLPENISSIGKYAFNYCSDLTKVNLPNSILTIGTYAFNDCALKSVNIPTKLQVIEGHTFDGCDFTTLTIPASVIAIKAGAFSYCNNLTEVIVSSANTQIVGTAFNKSGLKIYGLIGSAAETYAATKGYVFEAMDDVVYSVTFDANGGTSAPSKQNKGFGTPISLTREYPVKKHCTFLGWSTTADGEVEYLSGDTFNEDKDIVLYAVWAEPTITVKSKSGVIGKEVKVTIDIKNNPGIAGMLLKLNYSPELTLKKVEKGSALENLVFTEPGDLTSNPVNLLWDGMEADASNGEIIILTFEIPANTVEKDYTISLSYEGDDVYDAEMCDIDVKLVSGILSSKRVSKGDMDGDDKINTKDITLLRRFIAGGYSTENIVPEAADIDNDTTVNTRDVVLLRRFIAGGYGVELN